MHEPRVALDGGADGLEVLRRVTAAAPLWLAPGGHLLVETSERQAPQAAETFAREGLIPRVASSDELDATVVIGTRTADTRSWSSSPSASTCRSTTSSKWPATPTASPISRRCASASTRRNGFAGTSSARLRLTWALVLHGRVTQGGS
jgi:hypothetical protein